MDRWLHASQSLVSMCTCAHVYVSSYSLFLQSLHTLASKHDKSKESELYIIFELCMTHLLLSARLVNHPGTWTHIVGQLLTACILRTD